MERSYHLGELEQCVLCALIKLKDNAYGVSIQNEIYNRTGRNISYGALYTTLIRLEAKGFTTSRWGERTPERGGKAKKYFNINAQGEKALRQTETIHSWVLELIKGVQSYGRRTVEMRG